MARLVASHEWYLRQVGDAKQFISNTKDRRKLTYEQSSASTLLLSTILNILLESHLNLLAWSRRGCSLGQSISHKVVHYSLILQLAFCNEMQ